MRAMMQWLGRQVMQWNGRDAQMRGARAVFPYLQIMLMQWIMRGVVMRFCGRIGSDVLMQLLTLLLAFVGAVDPW